MGKRKLPDMQGWSEAQIAAFWDEHSPLDFEDALEPAALQFERPTLQPIAVKLEPSDIQALKAIARRRGVGSTTLIRMWVKERLRVESTSKTA